MQCVARSATSSYAGLVEGDTEGWGPRGLRACMVLHRDLRDVCSAVGRSVSPYLAVSLLGGAVVIALLLLSAAELYAEATCGSGGDSSNRAADTAGAALLIVLQTACGALLTCVRAGWRGAGGVVVGCSRWLLCLLWLCAAACRS